MDKTSIENPGFLHYRLEADTLCLGERIRGSLFRPCLSVFTYTALIGALKVRFPQPYRKVHAVGRFLRDGPDANRREIMTFSPRDRGREVSVVPLEIEYLANVRAEIFILKNDFTINFPGQFTFHLGAMKSKGFGQSHMTRIGETQRANPQPGKLAVRIPDKPQIHAELGIRRVAAPIYGYLFQPETGGTGHYTRALFEGSQVVADPSLLQPKEANS